MKLKSSGQGSVEDVTALEVKTKRRKDYCQTATSEISACYVFFRLLGPSRSIPEFHPPNSPYSTATTQNESVEKLPGSALVFQNKYIK